MRSWNQIYFSFDDWFVLVLILEMLSSSNYLLKMLKEFLQREIRYIFLFLSVHIIYLWSNAQKGHYWNKICFDYRFC